MRQQRIDQEIFDILKRQFDRGKGVSRHSVKTKGVFSAQTNMIHSKRTFQTYRQQGKAFAKWARANDIRKLKDLKHTDIGRWLEERQDIGDSAYTLKTRAAAMAKVLRCSSNDFGFNFPLRKTENIKRSRNPVKMDERLNEEKQADVITVAKGTGTRRVELQRLRPELLEIRDGKVYVSAINGKNGLIRKVPVLEKYQEAVIAVFDKCKTEKVFPGKIPTCVDVHSYRGGYAKEMYEQVLAKKAAKGEDATLDYHTRGEIRISLNKSALSEVSRALGHKRISVSVAHYLKHHFA